MEYQEAIEYIQNIQTDLGSDYSLKEVTELCRKAGNPEKKLKIIHIAGTNGKGSVGTYLANVFAQAGYTVGRYVSPTILDYCERVQKITPANFRRERKSYPWNTMKECFASKDEVAQALTSLKKLCEEMKQEGYGQPTAFEIETVMAFVLFAKWQVDVAIVECGLGGRLDATNCITNPLMCLFTSISKDHMGILGNTLEEIAKEKYGIIKENTLVVSLKQMFSYELLKKICKEKKAILATVHEEEITNTTYDLDKNGFTYKGERYCLRQNGVYQTQNALLAIEASLVLKNRGFSRITFATIKKALEESYWYGRFEVLKKNPYWIVDGAHNEEGALALAKSLDTYFPGKRLVYIMGMFQDKEYKKVLKILLPKGKKIYTVSTEGKRSLSCETLAREAQKQVEKENMKEKEILSKEDIIPCKTVEKAMIKAQKDNPQDHVILFGSLSFIHAIYQFMEQENTAIED